MSIVAHITCDGCGRAVSCGSGRERRPAHQVRAELQQAGWRITGTACGDFCPACALRQLPRCRHRAEARVLTPVVTPAAEAPDGE